MIAGIPSGFILTADISASGNFIAIGRMPAPTVAFVAALQDLLSSQADPELKEILTHSLASHVAGLCILDNDTVETALEACFLAQLVLDWRIEINGSGILQALFSVGRFEPVTAGGNVFALGLRLAGKPAFIALKDLAVQSQ